MDLDDRRRVVARSLVQPVDVLGDERVQLAAALELDQGTDWFQPSNIEITEVDVPNAAHNVIPGLAKALGDVAFEVIDTGAKTLARAQANADGYATLSGLGDKGSALLARRGRELTVIGLQEPALDLSEFDVGGHLSRNAKLFAYGSMVDNGSGDPVFFAGR